MKKFLDLGKQPITNSFLRMDELGDEYFYNLSLGFDKKTKLVSLMDTVDPTKMFNDTYAHRASMSKTMSDSFSDIALRLKKEYKPQTVLEIGSNDGVFIKNFSKEEVVAVEPCENLAGFTNKMGYKTYAEFWSTNLARKILDEHGEIDIIYSANTICHIEDLKEVFGAVYQALGKDGVFVFEDPSLLSILKNISYDQFYDEHVHVFSVIALQNLLKNSKLKIFRVENLETHGGSNRIYVKKIENNSIPIDSSVEKNIGDELRRELDHLITYERFAEKVKKSKNDLISLLSDLKRQGKKIISYGATYKSATIFNYCGIGTNFIDYITDTTLNKQGKLTPGMHIPIIPPEIGFNDTVDYAYLGAWNFKKEIVEKEKEFIKSGGKFITHVPDVRIIGE